VNPGWVVCFYCLLLFSLFLVHFCIIEVVHHFAGIHPRLPPTPERLLLNLLVRLCVLSLRTQNAWLAGGCGERVAPNDHAIVESPTPKMMVTVAAGPSKEVAGASAVVASALVVVSSAQLSSSAAGHASSGLRLEEDVVLQFDTTHRLSELTKS
jgi:hypothetical protein